MGYYDQPDPIEISTERTCDVIPGEEDGATEVCGHEATYDLQVSRTGHHEFTCEKCGGLNDQEDDSLVYPEPDEDYGRDR